jgi:hypothetical protein
MTEIEPDCYTTEVLERHSKVNQPDWDLCNLLMIIKFLFNLSSEMDGLRLHLIPLLSCECQISEVKQYSCITVVDTFPVTSHSRIFQVSNSALYQKKEHVRWGSDAVFIEASQGSVLEDEHNRRTV